MFLTLPAASAIILIFKNIWFKKHIQCSQEKP
jgi:hypothetical protein